MKRNVFKCEEREEILKNTEIDSKKKENEFSKGERTKRKFLKNII